MPASETRDGVPIEVIPGDKLNEYGLMQLDDDEQYFPVAVVGMGCRFPGAYDLREYRDVLMNQLITYKPLPEQGRWNRKEWATNPLPDNAPGYISCPSAGFLPTKRQFDYSFFNTSPKEAMAMEPQQHEAMEVTQEALDDGGFTPDNPLPSNTLVFLSMRMGETVPSMAENPNLMTPYILTGGAHTTLANRVSFFWDLRGGSMGVDGADAASTHSVHFGVWALWNRESDAAIVGGMNGILQTFYQLAMDDLGILSKSGMSRPFDADADGRVRSEGAAILILRPLAEALKAGNHIHCVIRASQCNFNSNAFTLGQHRTETFTKSIGGCYERFGIPPEKIDFVEAHATGTWEEDVMEMKALGEVFPKEGKLKIGSCKANLGHADCASGMSSIIKAALMIGKREFYPQANFSKVHPDLEDVSNVEIQSKNEKYTGSKNMMVGIDSFAYTGQVCHMIMEEYKNKYRQPTEADKAGWKFGEMGKKGRTVPVVLATKSKDALKDLVKKWKSFEWEDDDAQVVTSWLANRREQFSHRVVILANSTEDFRNKANMYLEGTPCDEVIGGVVQKETEPPKVCIVFPGQGQQWWDMGRQLYATEPVYREIVDECDRLWKKHSGYSFLEKDRTFVQDKGDVNPEDIDNILTAQPAIVSNQIGLYHLIRHWGIKEDSIVGHSLGEVAATYAAGGMTLEECMSSIYVRAYTQTKLAGTGSMAAARFSPKDADEFVAKYDDLFVACYNSTDNVTVAGGTPIVEKLAAENPKKLKIIRVQAAFHTPHLNAVKEEFYEMIQGKIEDRQTRDDATFYSTVTKGTYTGPFNPDYWWTNVSEPVFFTQATEKIFQDHGNNVIFLELGSSATMLSSIRQSAKKLGTSPAGYVHFGLRNKDDHQSALKGFAQLHTMGFPVKWQTITRDCGRYIPLPTYPFQRTFYELTAQALTDRLLDQVDKSYFGRHGKINPSDHHFLDRLRYQGKKVFPPSAIIEYFAEMCKGEGICLKDLSVERELPVLNGFNSDYSYEYSMIPNTHLGEKLSLFCGNEELLATATKLEAPPKVIASEIDIEGLKERLNSKMTASEVYDLTKAMGLTCDDDFKEVDHCWTADGEVLGQLKAPTNRHECLHTLTLEAATHIVLAAFSSGTAMKSLEKVKYLQSTVPVIEMNEPICVYAMLTDWHTDSMEVDMYLTTMTGKVLVAAEGCKFSIWAEAREKNDSIVYTLSEKIERSQLGEKKAVDAWELDLVQKEFVNSENSSVKSEEVKVRVKAAGQASGLLQCSGIIEEVGRSVTAWKVGDKVIALQPATRVQSLITCGENRILSKPEKLSWADASTFGITYGLAFMTLADTCEVQAGKKVIIYGSDGLPGQIFTSVAKALDAEVITIGNSSTIELPKGEDVNVIVNMKEESLPENILRTADEDCILCNVSFGKLPKTFFALDSHITYLNVNAVDCIARDFSALKTNISKAMDLLTEKKLTLLNVNATQLPNLPGNQDNAISSITVPDDFKPSLVSCGNLSIGDDAAYLINNGLSGTGLMLSEWLVTKGVTRLVLLSPHKANKKVHQLFLRNMKNAGIDVRVVQADAGNKDALLGAFDKLKSSGIDNIKGIFHLSTTGNEQSKVEGDNLRVVAKECKLALDYFMIISAGSGLSTSPVDQLGKSMDTLASSLQKDGIRSSNIRAGKLRCIDLLDEVTSLSESLAAQGTGPVDPKEWLLNLECLMMVDSTPNAAAILNQDWTAAYLKSTTNKAAFEHLVDMEDVKYRSQENERLMEKLTEVFHTWLANLLMWPLEVVDLDLPLKDHGVDLYITELINRWLQPRYNITIDWRAVNAGLTGNDVIKMLFKAKTQ